MRRGLRKGGLGRTETEPDLKDIQEALRGPGMDTRTWNSMGLVTRGPYLEATGGYFADVLLVPSGIGPVQCRLGSSYAGAGVGVFAPLKPGDEVNVEIPRGNINDGPFIGFRNHGPMALPPSDWSGEDYRIVSDKVIGIQGPGGSSVVLNQDGSITITSPDQLQTIKVNTATHQIEITGDQGVAISAIGNVAIQSAGLLVGGAANAVLLGSAFMEQLLIVLAAIGASTPGAAPAIATFVALANTLLSTNNFTD